VNAPLDAREKVLRRSAPDCLVRDPPWASTPRPSLLGRTTHPGLPELSLSRGGLWLLLELFLGWFRSRL
jgi:hypothetical protein